MALEEQGSWRSHELDAIVERVTSVVVKIETPSGHGTGFLCLYNEPRTFCGIATAYHVVRSNGRNPCEYCTTLLARTPFFVRRIV